MGDIIIVRGAGDLATGIAHRLYNCGFSLVLTEIERPLVVRRRVAFASAVLQGSCQVEGVTAIKAAGAEDIFKIWAAGSIPVLCDSQCSILKEIKPLAVVDAILAKRNTGTHRGMAPITIGVGPGFTAGIDVDAVVETMRGHYLGKVIYSGSAEPDTRIPGSIGGYSWERLLRAPDHGIISNAVEIGDLVKQGDLIAHVSGKPVLSLLGGVVRGLIADGTEVGKDMKIGDIDPRGIREYCFTISDKSRAVGGGVLEAIMSLNIGGQVKHIKD